MRAASSLDIRLLTHNIRYATSSPFKGEELWPTRAPRLVNELRFHTTHNAEAFICLQEVLHRQLVDVLSGLNAGGDDDDDDEWASIGVGREDGKQAGEYSPILYRPAVWQLEAWKTVWLSETPAVPSRGWDAASPRILTVGVFTHRRSKAAVVAMNTHLDDQGARARLEAARLIVQQAEEVGGWGGAARARLPVFLAGDFNSEPTQEAYRLLNGPASPLHDLRDVVEAGRYGHEDTFTGFDDWEKPFKRIDFLFLGPRSEDRLWEVMGYAVLENRFDDGVYLSDHRAVVGDVRLQISSG